MTESSTGRRTHTVDHIPRDAEQFVFLDNQVLDSLVSTVLELSAEVWTLRRRSLIVEKVIESRALIDRDAIETYRPTAEDEAEWRQLREAFMKRILGPLARKVSLDRPPVPDHSFMD